MLPWRTKSKYGAATGSDEASVNRQDLIELNRRLASISVTAVRDLYHTAYFACRLDGDHVPSARTIQELVQAWKQMRSWSKSPAPLKRAI